MVRILCVDDDPATTELLSLLLRFHGFQVLTTTQPREVVQLVLEHRPEALVLDLMMPEMDGFQVCRAVREVSTVPILILSALNDPRIIADALDSGADDYLVKPVPGNVLAAHLSHLIRRRESNAWQTEDMSAPGWSLKPSISPSPAEGS